MKNITGTFVKQEHANEASQAGGPLQTMKRRAEAAARAAPKVARRELSQLD